MDLAAAVHAVLATPEGGRWRLVPCPTCYAPRQEPCSGGRPTQRLGVRPHTARRRDAHELHTSLTLLTLDPAYVLGVWNSVRHAATELRAAIGDRKGKR